MLRRAEGMAAGERRRGEQKSPEQEISSVHIRQTLLKLKRQGRLSYLNRILISPGCY
jgi:hypothetical protein